jgi:hypothetical protein
MCERVVHNIKPLLSEVEKVIENGLNDLLTDYMERYKVLEKTHSQLMMLPSVELEFNRRTNDLNEKSINNDQEFFEVKLNKIEKLYDNILPILNKMFEKITILTEEINQLKKANLTPEVIQNNSIEKSSIVKTCENENIKLNIVENYDSDTEKQIVSYSLKEEEKKELIQQAKIREEEVEEEDEEEVEEDEEVEEEEEEVEEEVVEEVEEEEEEVEEEVEEEEKSVETEAKEESEEEEEEEEEEIFEIEIDDVTYCTNNDENGFIWELTEDGEQGEKVGYFKESEPFFYNEEN